MADETKISIVHDLCRVNFEISKNSLLTSLIMMHDLCHAGYYDLDTI